MLFIYLKLISLKNDNKTVQIILKSNTTFISYTIERVEGFQDFIFTSNLRRAERCPGLLLWKHVSIYPITLFPMVAIVIHLKISIYVSSISSVSVRDLRLQLHGKMHP
jgi:hypothetical protein